MKSNSIKPDCNISNMYNDINYIGPLVPINFNDVFSAYYFQRGKTIKYKGKEYAMMFEADSQFDCAGNKDQVESIVCEVCFKDDKISYSIVTNAALIDSINSYNK